MNNNIKITRIFHFVNALKYECTHEFMKGILSLLQDGNPFESL